jgi:hypothetical protein
VGKCNGVVVMRKTWGSSDGANRSTGGIGSIVVCVRKVPSQELGGGNVNGSGNQLFASPRLPFDQDLESVGATVRTRSSTSISAALDPTIPSNPTR